MLANNTNDSFLKTLIQFSNGLRYCGPVKALNDKSNDP